MEPLLPLPPHFDPTRVGQVWRVDYAQRAREARDWAARHGIPPAAEDASRVALVLIDVQNTFCIPDFELFVAGRSGKGAVEDNIRLCRFIYHNLHRITHIVATQDTHRAMQIFHPPFLVNDQGQHPEPYTVITVADVESGRWRFNPALAEPLGLSPEEGQRHLEHYVRTLAKRGKYALTVWPYHAMQGGIGHALVSAVEEAIFFHNVARYTQPEFILKGNHPLTEHYSALAPEVRLDADGRPLIEANLRLADLVAQYDAVVIAGQAKSHCVAWTVADLLDTLRTRNQQHLTRRVYLLDDCASPVVVPGADFSAQAETAYADFARAGMHRVTSTQPLETWPGLTRQVVV